jgi:release factor glutamine methyltransferase
MTIKEAIYNTENKFKKNNLPDAKMEADILLSHVLNTGREYLYAYQDKKISPWQNFILLKAVKRRLAGYSNAVIIGHKWFYGLDFIVNKNVLIPRPETELMVDEVLAKIKNDEFKIKNIIDLGTGSGCVIISIVKNMPTKEVGFYGLDISRPALKVAKKNAIKNNVSERIKFVYSNLLNVIDKSVFQESVIITANLPYLTPEQVKNSPTIQKEPKIALLAGNDGLDCYRQLFQQINDKLNGNKIAKLIVLCEIDETQRVSMEKLSRQNFPTSKICFARDLGGIERLAVIEL